jgi:Flp pilus assembly protein TadD
MKSESGTEPAAKPRLEAEVQRKLQSLGYVGGVQPPAKTSFGPADDLKTLLPYNQRFEEAQALYMAGELDQSIILLQRLIQDRPDFDNPYLFMVTILERQHRLAEAEALLKKGSESNPNNYKLAIEYGIALVQDGRNDEAIARLNKASGVIDWDPELWNYLGVAYWNKGDQDQALKAYERALSFDPKYAMVLANLGTVHVSLAVKNRDKAAFRRAIDYFKRSIECDPRYASAYNGLGAVYRMNGDLDAAISCWGQAVEIEPGHKYALYNLGTAYLEKGDKANALTYLTRYKDRYYKGLSDKDKALLDSDLSKCR